MGTLPRYPFPVSFRFCSLKKQGNYLLYDRNTFQITSKLGKYPYYQDVEKAVTVYVSQAAHKEPL